MKHLLTAALLTLLPSCVTSGDLLRVSEAVAGLEVSARDQNVTNEEFADMVIETTESIEAIAKEVEDRTMGLVNGLGVAGNTGLISLLSVIGLNLYRSSTRKKAIAEIKEGDAS